MRASPIVAGLILLGIAVPLTAQTRLRLGPHPGKGFRYKVEEMTTEVTIPRKGPTSAVRYDFEREVWQGQDPWPDGRIRIRTAVRWARARMNGRPLGAAVATGPEEIVTDLRGIPVERVQGATSPTPLVLPPEPLPPMLSALGEVAVPRIQWSYTVPASEAIPVSLVVKYWTEGPRTFLGRECVVIRGQTRGRLAPTADGPGIDVSGRLAVGFDPTAGVPVRTSAEVRISRFWGPGERVAPRRVARHTTLKSDLIGMAEWPTGTPPGPPIRPAASARSGGSGSR